MRRSTLPLLFIAPLTMLAAAPPLLLAGATPGAPVARALDAATRRAAERRAEIVTRAIGAIESADPVDAALSLHEAIEQRAGTRPSSAPSNTFAPRRARRPRHASTGCCAKGRRARRFRYWRA